MEIKQCTTTRRLGTSHWKLFCYFSKAYLQPPFSGTPIFCRPRRWSRFWNMENGTGPEMARFMSGSRICRISWRLDFWSGNVFDHLSKISKDSWYYYKTNRTKWIWELRTIKNIPWNLLKCGRIFCISPMCSPYFLMMRGNIFKTRYIN